MKFVGEVSTATASARFRERQLRLRGSQLRPERPGAAEAGGPVRSRSSAERGRDGAACRSGPGRELRRIGATGRPDGGEGRTEPASAPAVRAAEKQLQLRLGWPGVPSVGDEVEFIMPVDEDLSLENAPTRKRSSRRRSVSVGDHFVIVRDMQGTDAFSESDYAEIQAVLDDFIYEVDTEYFGETADIDANERVIVLITEEVNKLADLTDQLIFLGFFLPSDLANPVDCPASNAGEIVYLRAPDPDGEFGQETSVERAVEILKSTTSHEFQHLINSEQRFYPRQLPVLIVPATTSGSTRGSRTWPKSSWDSPSWGWPCGPIWASTAADLRPSMPSTPILTRELLQPRCDGVQTTKVATAG